MGLKQSDVQKNNKKSIGDFFVFLIIRKQSKKLITLNYHFTIQFSINLVFKIGDDNYQYLLYMLKKNIKLSISLFFYKKLFIFFLSLCKNKTRKIEKR